MWRLGEHLVGQCIHVGQEVQFVGATAAKIQNIYMNGMKVCNIAVSSIHKFSSAIGISWTYDNHYQNNLQIPLCKSDNIHTSLSRTLGIQRRR